MLKTSVKRLYVFDGGSLNVDQDRMRFSHRKAERWMTVPIPFYLIQTEEYNILFDTGCDPDVVKDPLGTWGSLAKVFVPNITAINHPVRRLAEVGLRPEQITHVVLSHLHFDHAGGLRFFPQAKIILQKAEFRYAQYPDAYSGGYFAKEFSGSGIQWEIIDGDQVLLPGVTLVLTNGHSPGHQSLVVDLPSGKTIILAADALNLQENIDRELVAPGSWNYSLAYHSIRRIKVIAERNQGSLLPSHDLGIWQSLTKAPFCYE